MTCSGKWQINASCVAEQTLVDATEVAGRPLCKNPHCQRPLQEDGSCSRGCAQVLAPASVLEMVGQWYDEFPATLEGEIVAAGGQPFPGEVLSDTTIPPDVAMRRLRGWYESLGRPGQQSAQEVIGWDFPLDEIDRVRAQEEKPRYVLVDQRGRLVAHELFTDVHAVYTEAVRLWDKHGDFIVPHPAPSELVDELMSPDYTAADLNIAFAQWHDQNAPAAERALAAEVLARIAATSAGKWSAADVTAGTVDTLVSPEQLDYWLHVLESLDVTRAARVRAELLPPPPPPDPCVPSTFAAFAPTMTQMVEVTKRIMADYPPQGEHSTWEQRVQNLRAAELAQQAGLEGLERREAILLLNQLAEATAQTLQEQDTGRVPPALTREAQRALEATREMVTALDGRYGPPTLTAHEQAALRRAYKRWHDGEIEIEPDEEDEGHYMVRARFRPDQEGEGTWEVYPAQGQCSGDCMQHSGSRCPHLLLAMHLWRTPQPFTPSEAQQFLAAARRDGWVEQEATNPPFFYHIKRGDLSARIHIREGVRGQEPGWASVEVRRSGLAAALVSTRYDLADLETGLHTCGLCGARSTEMVAALGQHYCPACAATVQSAGQAAERRRAG